MFHGQEMITARRFIPFRFTVHIPCSYQEPKGMYKLRLSVAIFHHDLDMAAFTPLNFSLIIVLLVIASNAFSTKEASIDDLQLAFKQNKLTSRKLVKFYIKEVDRLNPVLKGVLEVNPDALLQANQADYERRIKAPGSSVGLHGIPILLKDLIATKDKMNNTAGSFALLGSVVPRDAGVVMKLRKAGAIIFGKASMTEWAAFRSLTLPNGFSPRGGQGKARSL